jgi:hypothetical protein
VLAEEVGKQQCVLAWQKASYDQVIAAADPVAHA